MEKPNNKKQTKLQQKSSCDDFGKALRSSGILIPESEEEIQLFNEINAGNSVPIPEKFKSIDFIFEENPSNAKIIPFEKISTTSEDVPLSYAARDGEEKLPESITRKMTELKNKSREKNNSRLRK